jgi:hypothetical protein
VRLRPGAISWIIAAIVACAAGASTGCGSGGPSAVVRERTPSNLDVMRTLVAAIGGGVLDSSGRSVGDTVALDVDSSAVSWIARTEIAALIGRSGRAVVAGVGAAPGVSRWNVRGLTLNVEYRDIRRPGLFSGAVVDRVVSAAFTSELTNDGAVAYAGTAGRSAVDTVAGESVPDLEAGSPEATRGTVPDMQTLDRFVEPLVIIGAAGAAIFLFFQVRS